MARSRTINNDTTTNWTEEDHYGHRPPPLFEPGSSRWGHSAASNAKATTTRARTGQSQAATAVNPDSPRRPQPVRSGGTGRHMPRAIKSVYHAIDHPATHGREEPPPHHHALHNATPRPCGAIPRQTTVRGDEEPKRDARYLPGRTHIWQRRERVGADGRTDRRQLGFSPPSLGRIFFSIVRK